ncbi:pyridoxal-dependent decarboxylase, exosortase A system-associated [Rheinheimera riviphila]|uniref:Pyridoxal-dependent decarboxylase, exosortase A system-associated n=1 Tax=Rheinheimera riviphila TaxID=1834037 RepID=A0A437QSW7_9GAMM|nr:pyridoxal-dependent decarboxylase, exosortase A system-associated [Rheinheimera riviphila]RVU37595.1 pyridoxal-dependent decarboxylase, exosortase A system-associated [Rheinheimera riviphila]
MTTPKPADLQFAPTPEPLSPLLATQPQLAVPLSYLQTVAGTLQIGGKSMQQIADVLGQQRFYAYDRQAITQKIRQLRSKMPAQLKLHYAIKANPYLPVVQHVGTLVDGFDVASQGELLLALQTGMSAAKISFAGPGKTDAELRAALTAGCCVHIESVGELHRLCAIASQCGQIATIALRVNPEFELKAAGMKMAGGAKAFGIDQQQVLALLPKLSAMPVQLVGFHLYCGSQNLQADAILQTQQQIMQLLLQLLPLCPTALQFVNLGGGLGVPYYSSDRAVDLDKLAEGWAELFEKLPAELQQLEFILELGRYLVAEAGVYACKVVDIKQSHGQTFVVCNGGMHHHLANSGNFGQVIRRNYPVAFADKLDQPLVAAVQVVGPLCTPLDVLADKIQLPKAEVGDWFVVLQSGAYGATASPQAFLGHGVVAEILL